jgi:hypothetical protein
MRPKRRASSAVPFFLVRLRSFAINLAIRHLFTCVRPISEILSLEIDHAGVHYLGRERDVPVATDLDNISPTRCNLAETPAALELHGYNLVIHAGFYRLPEVVQKGLGTGTMFVMASASGKYAVPFFHSVGFPMWQRARSVDPSRAPRLDFVIGHFS